MKILVTGGSGMLGQHLKQELYKDTLFPNRNELDLTNYNQVLKYIEKNKPTHIVHAAAKVGGIISNISYPCDFFEENIIINTNIVKASRTLEVKNFLAILSTCIFPDKVESYPITENMLHDGQPTPTNLSYGYAKRCLAVQIEACNKQYKTNYNYIIPCNLYSEFDKIDNNDKMHFVTAFIQKIIRAEKESKKEIHLLGTGKPLRQFMYAGDLAKIIKIIIDNNIKDNFCVVPDNSNLSINEIAIKILKLLNKEHLKIIYDKTKPDGQYRKDASNEKMKKYIPEFNFKYFEDTIERIYNSAT